MVWGHHSAVCRSMGLRGVRSDGESGRKLWPEPLPCQGGHCVPWLFSSKASLRWLRAGWLLCCAVSLWQCCQSAGVFFEDLAEIVCPSDPPRSRRAFLVQGFFPGFGKTGMDLVAGSVGCGVAYIFEG